jgi:hypothetical protein
MGLLPGWEWKAKTHVKRPGMDDETRRLVDEVVAEEAEGDGLL